MDTKNLNLKHKKLPKYIDGTGWRYDSDHTHSYRLPHHDYSSRCIYMLTLTLEDRSQPLLGHLIRNDQGKALLVASPLGEKVEHEWWAIMDRYPQLEVWRVQLMEEHLHVVLFVKEQLPVLLSQVVATVKSLCNRHYWDLLRAEGRLGPKGTAKPPRLFSDGFHDTILSHEGQLEQMKRYVEENPERAMTKRENPDLFKVVSEVEIRGRRYAAIGNRWLVDRPLTMQVRCHNSDSSWNMDLTERQKEYFMERAKRGGVVVSPCISQGEKDIARAVMEAGLPLVVILENGFAPLFKPPGRYFEACAKGLLLMLAPWPHHRDKRTITRQQCLELNDMARSICTEPWTEDREAAVRNSY